MIRKLKNLSRLMTGILLAATLLAGCATTDFGGRSGSQAERRAETLARDGRHGDAAGVYIGLASEASGTERDRLTLLAVEQWLDAGDGRRARTAMFDVAMPVGGELRWIWNTNRAAIELWEGRPDGALNILEPMAAQSLPVTNRARVQALRGDAWFQKDDPLRAIGLYTQREELLADPHDVATNRARLWAGLLVSNVQTMRRMANVTADPIARGWLSLGALAASTGQQGIGWKQRRGPLAGNPFQSPGHERAGRRRVARPRHARLSAPGSAAPAAQRAERRGRQRGAKRLFWCLLRCRRWPRRGPANPCLRRSRRRRARALPTTRPSTMAPNLSSDRCSGARSTTSPARTCCRCHCSPSTTCRRTRWRHPACSSLPCHRKTKRSRPPNGPCSMARPVASPWSPTTTGADGCSPVFSSAFETRGGTLLEYRFYQPTDQDFSFEIQNLMGLSLSQQRYQRLRANLGGALEFDPRRRADAEFVFLAAAAPVGRLIKSQLKFHYSGDLPVYSTSRIFAMDGRSNSDLNGVMFADTPWIIAPQPWIADLPSLYGEYWPNQRRLGRLHAMGYDAYLLLGELYGSRGEMQRINGASGELFLDEAGRVHRRLPWAEFRRGEVVSLVDPLEADSPSGEDVAPDPAGESPFPVLEL